MIKIGQDKLFSMSEILDNYVGYIGQHEVFEPEVALVAALIEEDVDFVKGYIRAASTKAKV